MLPRYYRAPSENSHQLVKKNLEGIEGEMRARVVATLVNFEPR